ncbi:MAG: hypothetical protein H7Y42_00455 [Chitinophagaceae bacterium]|nr:hypothetical protein [Chitinophagaceae bacterium]
MKKENFVSSSRETESGTAPHIFELILDTFSIGIKAFKPRLSSSGQVTDFEYVFVNEVAQAELGDRTIENKTLLGLFPTHVDTFDRLARVLKSSESIEVIYSIGEDGTARWVRERYLRFEDLVLLCTQDITEQMRNEERVTELNATLSLRNRQLATLNSELQTFTNIAANNYKDTLRNLYTGLEFIASQEAPRLSDTGKANVRRAQAAIQKMKLLTEDIITYSSIPSLDKEVAVVDLMNILEGLKKDLATKLGPENIRINCVNIPAINGYPALLSLLFHHLIDNCIKFRKENHPLDIHIECEEGNGVELDHPSAMPHVKYVSIAITDNGMGFDPDKAEDIFAMFYRANEKNKYKGSGIGLAVCRKIMDIHSGFILAKAIPDEGATFHCYFPLPK